MSQIPTSDTLANLVAAATESMFGMSFVAWEATSGSLPWEDPDERWHTITVPLEGARPILVAAGSDDAGGRALAAAMFACSSKEVDADMIRDGIGELVNVLAGQVKSAMSLTQKIGLPRALLEDSLPTDEGGMLHATVLRTSDEVQVWVAVAEFHPAAEALTAPALPTPQQIESALAAILGRPVAVAAWPRPLGAANVLAGTYGKGGDMDASCLCDLPLAAALGAAARREPDSAAKDAVAQNALPAGLGQAAGAALDAVAQAFLPASPRMALHEPHSAVPAALAAQVESPAQAVHTIVNVPGYGRGRLSVIAPKRG